MLMATPAYRFPRFATGTLAGQPHLGAAARARTRSRTRDHQDHRRQDPRRRARQGRHQGHVHQGDRRSAGRRPRRSCRPQPERPCRPNCRQDLNWWRSPTRENPRDVFLSVKYDSIQSLPQGRARRHQQPASPGADKALRPDLDIHPLRGNVDTRVRKLEQGEYDAIILAFAGTDSPGQDASS